VSFDKQWVFLCCDTYGEDESVCGRSDQKQTAYTDFSDIPLVKFHLSSYLNNMEYGFLYLV
jgi:hypothetical protein